MKKLTLIFLLFISNLAIAQEFKTSVILSPGISWFTSTNLYAVSATDLKLNNIRLDNIGIDYCFSGAIREELYVNKTISYGIELNYLYTYGYLYSPGGLTPWTMQIFNYIHYLSIQSLYMPLFIKLRTNPEKSKGIYIYFGTAFTDILHTDSKIYIADNDPPIKSGTVTIKTQNNNDIGMIELLGIGKSFKIKKKTFFCEAKFNFDLNKWIYPTINGVENNPIDIKQQCLLLNLGYTF